VGSGANLLVLSRKESSLAKWGTNQASFHAHSKARFDFAALAARLNLPLQNSYIFRQAVQSRVLRILVFFSKQLDYAG
jgi:hypothetical protein